MPLIPARMLFRDNDAIFLVLARIGLFLTSNFARRKHVAKVLSGSARNLALHATSESFPPPAISCGLELSGSMSVLSKTENMRHFRTRNPTQFENDVRSRVACSQAITATSGHRPLCGVRGLLGSHRPSLAGRNGGVAGLVCGDCPQ